MMPLGHQYFVKSIRTVTTQDQSQKAKRDTLATRVDGPGYLDTCSKVNFCSGKTAEIGLTEMQYNGVCTSCSYAMHTLHIMHTTRTRVLCIILCLLRAIVDRVYMRYVYYELVLLLASSTNSS